MGDLSPFYITKGPKRRREKAEFDLQSHEPFCGMGSVFSASQQEVTKPAGGVARAQEMGKSGHESRPRAEVRGQRGASHQEKPASGVLSP